jgi:hypothetical protein
MDANRIDEELLVEQESLCKDIYKQQVGIAYLFGSGSRNKNIKQHCNQEAKDQETRIKAANSGLLGTVMGKMDYSYEEAYSKCLRQFGL